MDKIKYLCKNIVKDEWSGLLFYEVKGSIKKPQTMEIVIRDLLLMDKGNKVYTSFDWDEDIVQYRMKNLKSMDWIVGHIHSHNDMRVFFSGTDWSELNDNCPHHNYYLSIIVNNYLDIEGKVAFTADPTNFICKDEDGKDYKFKIEGIKFPPIMCVYDCQIIHNQETLKVDNSFSDRLKDVVIKSEKKKAIEEKKFKEEEEKRKAALAKNSTVKNFDWSKAKGSEDSKSPFPSYFPKGKNKHNDIEEDMMTFTDEHDDMTDEEKFTAFIMRLGNVITRDTLEAAVEAAYNDIHNNEGISALSIAKSITDTFPSYYDNFFHNATGYQTDEEFLETLESVIDYLRDYEDAYPFVSIIIDELEQFGNRFETTLKEEPLILN